LRSNPRLSSLLVITLAAALATAAISCGSGLTDRLAPGCDVDAGRDAPSDPGAGGGDADVGSGADVGVQRPEGGEPPKGDAADTSSNDAPPDVSPEGADDVRAAEPTDGGDAGDRGSAPDGNDDLRDAVAQADGDAGDGHGDVRAEVGATEVGAAEVGATEAGAAEVGATDGGTPIPCARSQPFGTPVPVPGLNNFPAMVDSARFSPDELTAYLGMFYPSGAEVFTATRASRDAAFGAPVPIDALNGPAVNDYATLTADGRVLFMESTRDGTWSLYTAERASALVNFPTPTALTAVNTGHEGNPYVLPDGSALYFHTYRNNSLEIYRAPRSGGIVGTAASVAAINTANDEETPVVSADDLTIYYRHTGSSQGSIWMATRQSTSDAFSNPVPLSELNGPQNVLRPEWISFDDCRLYFQEQDANGGIWVYVAERKSGGN
jgi:hypothetical protein